MADGKVMKPAVALVAVSLVSLFSPRAAGVETSADVETDHVTTADDRGPHTVGLLLRPLSMTIGWLGAELDAAAGENVVMSVEGAQRGIFGGNTVHVDLGVALYRLGYAFHGVYVHPIVEWIRAMGPGAASSALGGGFTAGYAWTWPVGTTVRLGGGVAYTRSLGTEGEGMAALEGLRPRVDGDVGWVF